jgi:hypothetical protein
MRKAFKPVAERAQKANKATSSPEPLTDVDAEYAEQETAHLFAGAFGYCRNTHSHKDIRLKAEDAVHMLVLASSSLDMQGAVAEIIDKPPGKNPLHENMLQQGVGRRHRRGYFWSSSAIVRTPSGPS